MSDLIVCDGCGRSFTTDHGTEMLAAIKGPCPTCGGGFRLVQLTDAADELRPQPPLPPASR